MIKEQDKIKLIELKESLYMVVDFDYIYNKKPTESLYRFGFFKINGYVYYIAGWNFKTKIVTLFCDELNLKIKFDIEHKTISTNEFPSKPIFDNIKKYLKRIWNAIKGEE